MSSQIKIFVINLKRSVERRNEIEKLMCEYELDYEIFEAINGIELSDDFVKACREKSDHWYHQDWGNEHSMKLGEMGVALSHVGVYKKIIDEDLGLALILEDDACFDQRLQNILTNRARIGKVMSQFDLVLLGYCDHDNIYDTPASCSFWGKQKISASFKVGIPLKWYWSAVGYLISKKGAQLLYNKQTDIPEVTADILTANSPKYGVHLGILTKPIIWPGELSKYSLIQGDGQTIVPISNSNRGENQNGKNNIKSVYQSLKNFFPLLFLKLSRRHYSFTTSKY